MTSIDKLTPRRRLRSMTWQLCDGDPVLVDRSSKKSSQSLSSRERFMIRHDVQVL